MYSNVKYTSRVPLIFSQLRQANMTFLILSSSLSFANTKLKNYTVFTSNLHNKQGLYFFLLLVRGACQPRLASYGSKHALQSLSNMPFPTYYTHNSKTKGCITTLYLLNNRSTIRDIYSLGQSCMHDTICKIWIQTCTTTASRYDFCAYLHM